MQKLSVQPNSRETAVQSSNDSLQSVSESLVRLKKIGETNYSKTKVAKTDNAARKKIFIFRSDEGTYQQVLIL
jgi:hypothetical protein